MLKASFFFFTFVFFASAQADSGLPKSFKFILDPTGKSISATLGDVNLSDFEFKENYCKRNGLLGGHRKYEYRGPRVSFMLGNEEYYLAERIPATSDKVGRQRHVLFSGKTCDDIRNVSELKEITFIVAHAQIPEYFLYLKFSPVTGEASYQEVFSKNVTRGIILENY